MRSFAPENFLILIVDDLPQNLQVIASILDQAGYATTFAMSGMQAIERLKTIRPDLILLDLMMPEMTGLEVCQILKTNPNYESTPVIFLTASHEQYHVLEAFNLGAVDYITKPFNAPELLARVKVHLELKYTKDQLQQSLLELEKLAVTDALTNIPNRRYLITFAEKEISRARRHDHLFSLFMMDLDHFKHINDNYGHAIGDEVLKMIAQTTTQSLRKEDCFGRLGGEEFLGLLPYTSHSLALQVAERIRQNIASLSFPLCHKSLKVTVSIGVATYQNDKDDLDSLLKRADEALFEAKDRGRNQVILHQEDAENCLAS